MIPIVLRNAFQKIILALGFTALIVVMTGANVSGNSHGSSIATDMFKLPNMAPSPLLVNQCGDDKWLKNGFIMPFKDLNKNCITTKEGKNEHSKGLAFLQKQ